MIVRALVEISKTLARAVTQVKAADGARAAAAHVGTHALARRHARRGSRTHARTHACTNARTHVPLPSTHAHPIASTTYAQYAH